MGKTALTLMIITLLSKVTGLVREQFFASYLGTGPLIDAYSTATTIPMIIFSFIISGVVAGYIPIYSKIEFEKGPKKAQEFTSNLINILMIVSTGLLALILVAAPLLVTLFAPGYDQEKYQLTIDFTRIMAFSIYTSIASSVFIGYLQYHNRFIVAETPGIIMNFLNVIFLVVAVSLGNIYLIAIGFVVTEALKYFLFPRTLKQEHYVHKWKFDFKDPHIKEILVRAIPIVLSIAAVDLSTISDQSFASSLLADGGVSSMRFANLILQLVHGVIVVSIITTTYPSLAKYANTKDHDSFNKTIMDGTNITMVLMIPATIGIMILAQPLIRLLFERGNFDAESTAVTAGVLVYYIPTVIGGAISALFIRGFYALQNTVTPIIVTVIQVVTNIVLNYILSQYFGLNGLAMATSISSTLGGLLAVIFFRMKYGKLNFSSLLITIIKVGIVSAIMALVTAGMYMRFQEINGNLAFVISILASILVYSILIVFMRIPQVMTLINSIYKKIAKK